MMTWVCRALATLLALSWFAATPATAADPDTLVAAQVCPAYQSIKKRTNSGEIYLETGRTYQVVARNKTPATWLQVVIVEASPKARWVEVGCGEAGGPPTPPVPGPAGDAETHLLVLSWQPTFCLTHAKKPECLAASPEARQLSLHGLWPQPKGRYYCIDDPKEKARLAALDGAKEWALLPDPPMTAETRARLAAVMPGTQSFLERHEWIKHGTCFGGSPDAYFNRSIDLLEQVNTSPVGKLLAEKAGKPVQTSDTIAAFRSAFGDAAAKAVVVTCDKVGGVQDVAEIWIYLSGDVAGSAPLKALLHPGSYDESCASGVLVQPKAS